MANEQVLDLNPEDYIPEFNNSFLPPSGSRTSSYGVLDLAESDLTPVDPYLSSRTNLGNSIRGFGEQTKSGLSDWLATQGVQGAQAMFPDITDRISQILPNGTASAVQGGLKSGIKSMMDVPQNMLAMPADLYNGYQYLNKSNDDTLTKATTTAQNVAPALIDILAMSGGSAASMPLRAAAGSIITSLSQMLGGKDLSGQDVINRAAYFAGSTVSPVNPVQAVKGVYSAAKPYLKSGGEEFVGKLYNKTDPNLADKYQVAAQVQDPYFQNKSLGQAVNNPEIRGFELAPKTPDNKITEFNRNTENQRILSEETAKFEADQANLQSEVANRVSGLTPSTKLKNEAGSDVQSNLLQNDASAEAANRSVYNQTEGNTPIVLNSVRVFNNIVKETKKSLGIKDPTPEKPYIDEYGRNAMTPAEPGSNISLPGEVSYLGGLISDFKQSPTLTKASFLYEQTKKSIDSLFAKGDDKLGNRLIPFKDALKADIDNRTGGALSTADEMLGNRKDLYGTGVVASGTGKNAYGQALGDPAQILPSALESVQSTRQLIKADPTSVPELQSTFMSNLRDATAGEFDAKRTNEFFTKDRGKNLEIAQEIYTPEQLQVLKEAMDIANTKASKTAPTLPRETPLKLNARTLVADILNDNQGFLSKLPDSIAGIITGKLGNFFLSKVINIGGMSENRKKNMITQALVKANESPEFALAMAERAKNPTIQNELTVRQALGQALQSTIPAEANMGSVTGEQQPPMTQDQAIQMAPQAVDMFNGLQTPQEQPFANGLPRTSAAWDENTIGYYMNMMQGSGTAVIGIQLGKKLIEAKRAGDSGQQRRVIADIAKLYPEMFEPGQGVDDRLFHPDDQKAYMKILRNGMAKGTVDANFLAKQHLSFADENDSRILDLSQAQGGQSRQQDAPPRQSTIPDLPSLITNPPY